MGASRDERELPIHGCLLPALSTALQVRGLANGEVAASRCNPAWRALKCTLDRGESRRTRPR